jgi:excisionase family DNA binding protein
MPESSALATRALRLLSIDEVAVVLRTTRKAVYQLRARGQLGPFVHVGRRLLMHEQDLLEWLQERRVVSPENRR